jgi:hypothetical protein
MNHESLRAKGRDWPQSAATPENRRDLTQTAAHRNCTVVNPSATTRQGGLMLGGNKDPVMEHKGLFSSGVVFLAYAPHLQ